MPPAPPPTAYVCPICLSAPTVPSAPPCGHIFCYECITTHLHTRKTCPTCSAFATADVLHPTSPPPPPSRPGPAPSTPLLSRTPDLTTIRSSRRAAPPPLPRPPLNPSAASPAAQAARRARAEARACAALAAVTSEGASTPTPAAPTPTTANTVSAGLAAAAALAGSSAVASSPPSPTPSSTDALLAGVDRLSAEQLAGVIAHLSNKLQAKERSDRHVENRLLLHFLQHTRRQKEGIITQLRAQLDMLSQDIAAVDASCAALRRPRVGQSTSITSQPPDEPSLSRKQQLLIDNHDELQSHYFETVARYSGDDRKDALHHFTDDIFKLTQYSRLNDRATLMHVARVPDTPCNDVFKASNIVSSMEFDRESEFLATAGVTRRIKIFEFSNVTRNLTDLHYPIREIPTQAKLSWVCWNPYIRHHLVSSDYEGVVKLWDVNLAVSLSDYEEHESRAWSVDYCPTKPTYFASGSDDGTVKLWTTSQRGSVMTVDNKPANVCSVKFHPTSAHMLAFGSVDSKVQYYDLRNIRTPLHTFASHSRAVSYVKFMSDNELVSASVDSTIKLWDLKTLSLARTFNGHANDRNFVGLSVTEDYIACGSEQNAVYCYYKSIPPPITAYRFSSVDPLTGEETQDDDESQFVSSVCWCPGDPTMLVAANSLGAMKVLSLDPGEDDDDDSSENKDSRGSESEDADNDLDDV